MANIFDYIKNCGGSTFDEMEFNHIDGLILARFSYIPFDEIVSPSFCETICVSEAVDRFLKLPMPEKKVFLKEDIAFIKSLAQSRRFSSLGLFGYRNKVSITENKQFAVITIKLNKQLSYVSFRGTDNTFVGFKEDCDLCFDAPIPSQDEALKYFRKFEKEKSRKFILGGHSKGGNIAVYAASFCSKELQERVVSIYNIDGPGFTKSLLNKEGYQRICSKIYTFVPQSSLVGKLFERNESEIVIHSTYWWLLQHDIYSWEIDGSNFVHMESTTHFSRIMGCAIKQWLEQMDAEQKKKFIDFVFGAIESANVTTVDEFVENKLKNTISVLKSVSKTDKELRRDVYAEVFALLQSFVKSAGTNLPLPNFKGR